MRVLVVVLAALLATPAVAETFTNAERAAILRHGPWPPPIAPDMSNRLEGDAAAIELGQALFDAEGLSRAGTFACSSCHEDGLHFADGRKVALAAEPLTRNTPSLLNVRFNRWFGWGGANDTLWGASIRPLLADDEMATTAERVAAYIADDRRAADLYTSLFGEPEAETVLVNVGKALAAFQATLVSDRSAFDVFRDGLARGDASAVGAYPAAAKRGLKLFVGSGRCSLCHAGPLFTNGEFEDVAVPYFTGPGQVDPGRHAGLAAFRATLYTRAGPHSDGPDDPSARLTANVRRQHKDWGAFRVPSLRLAPLTAPYMHDGSLATLEDVVRHYSEIDLERLHQDGAAILRPLNLTDDEIADLVAFLKTL